MLRLATAAQSREIDQQTQAAQIASAEILMESAAVSSAVDIRQSFVGELKRPGPLVIFCGPGNNGGDGLALARHLASMGESDIQIVLATETGSPLFSQQLSRCQHLGLAIHHWPWSQAKPPRLIIDAIFGVGLTRDLAEPFSSMVKWMNSQKVPVVSLDVPSGLDADCGTVRGRAVKANSTVSFGLGKPGFFVHEGPNHVGRLHVHPIGFPKDILERLATTHFLFDLESAAQLLPKRAATSNKSDHGHALIIAGRAGTWGAAILATQACYRTGVGYLTLASGDDPRSFLPQMPEVLTADMNDPQLFTKAFSAVAIGCGLGVTSETAHLLETLKQKKIERVVVDADALTVCAQNKLLPLPSSWVVTPHAGELSRILEIPAAEIEKDRFTAIQKAQQRIGCWVLLKGFRTVVYGGHEIRIIDAGNSALAKAGSGDVLTGIITGFLAQGLAVEEAICLGAFVHGRLADRWVKTGHSRLSLQPSDLIEHLPRLLNEFENWIWNVD